MTVADKVRNMTDKQLARFVISYDAHKVSQKWCNGLCPDRKDGDCDCPYGEYETALGWLKSEVKE